MRISDGSSDVCSSDLLFIMTGPNTALGHNSMVYMIEAQASYVTDAIAQLARRPGAALDVDAAVQREYNTALQQRLAHTVWNTSGCNSSSAVHRGGNEGGSRCCSRCAPYH